MYHLETTSRINGAPIVLLFVGIARASANAKTGPLVQNLILDGSQAPIDAVKNGADASVCGGCRLRPSNKAKLLPGESSCYVLTWRLRANWQAYISGRYRKLDLGNPQHVADLNSRAGFRFGAYGDPAALDPSLFDRLFACVHRGLWTAYTHQWRSEKLAGHLRGRCLASVTSEASAREAVDRGWDFFAALPRGVDASDWMREHASRCGAAKEVPEASRITCATCPAPCDGAHGSHYLRSH